MAPMQLQARSNSVAQIAAAKAPVKAAPPKASGDIVGVDPLLVRTRAPQLPNLRGAQTARNALARPAAPAKPRGATATASNDHPGAAARPARARTRRRIAAAAASTHPAGSTARPVPRIP